MPPCTTSLASSLCLSSARIVRADIDIPHIGASAMFPYTDTLQSSYADTSYAPNTNIHDPGELSPRSAETFAEAFMKTSQRIRNAVIYAFIS